MSDVNAAVLNAGQVTGAIDLGATVLRAGQVTADVRASSTLANVRVGGVNISENTDYERLRNKPQINEVELIGNKTFRQLGLDFATVAEVESILYLD